MPGVVVDRPLGSLPAAHGPVLGFVPWDLVAALAYDGLGWPHCPGCVSCCETTPREAVVADVGKDPLVLLWQAFLPVNLTTPCRVALLPVFPLLRGMGFPDLDFVQVPPPQPLDWRTRTG